MNEKHIAINDLQPIARRLREREEVIAAKKRAVFEHIGELTGLAAEQGQDLLLAKTKLGKHLRWSEWLGAHVPNLPEQQASKYERIATEQLRDPRQCVFAFLPPIEKDITPARTPPKVWERVWGFVHKVQSALRDAPLEKWPENQVEQTKREIEPVAKALWPEKF